MAKYKSWSVRDYQRGKVYKSEGCLSKPVSQYGGRLETIPEIEAWIYKINESRWLQGYLNRQIERRGKKWVWKARIDIGDGRGRRHACAQYYSFQYRVVLKFPRNMRSKLVILHELAHAYTNWVKPAPHGREFCANYLEFVKRWLGKEAHAELQASFKRNRVKYRRSNKQRAKKTGAKDNYSSLIFGR